jgi:hypothetical protein
MEGGVVMPTIEQRIIGESEEGDVETIIVQKRSTQKSSREHCKKKHKVVQDVDPKFWNSLTFDDKVTICHRITTVRSREKVVSCLKVLIKTRQEVGLALPKLPKTSKEKKGDVALIEVIAKWAMEIGLVEFIGEKGVGRYYIQD